MPPHPSDIAFNPNASQARWHVVAELAGDSALAWVNQSAAESALAASGVFHLVLAGGGTPEKLYRALANSQQDWSRWHIWFGDERCLPR
jgi:6-phosphogluconolactonase